ncbi:MAG: hypothetical protein IJW40_04010 [Clostridia bacterium]|nr:hypothetical protein [Clostridia bacterium]
MKKFTIRRAAAIVLAALLLCGTLSSCGVIADGLVGAINKETATVAVQGNLDVLYLGQINEDYLALTEDTEEDLLKVYEEGLAFSAEYFAYYWGILGDGETMSDLDETLQQRLIDLYEKISHKVKYEVQPAQAQDNSYTVKVVIQPVDIINQANDLYDNGGYAPLVQILTDAESLDWANMTEAQYWEFANRYGNVIVDMFETLLPELGYLAEKSVIIQVEDVDGYLTINSDDISNLDMQIIPFE